MQKQVYKVISKVIHKYNLSYTMLYTKAKPKSRLSYAKQEIVYRLTKELRLNRSNISEVLNLSISNTYDLLRKYCLRHNLSIPKVIRKTDISTLTYVLLDKKDPDFDYLFNFLSRIYWNGYSAGIKKRLRKEEKLRKSSFQGVPKVPSCKNNASTGFSEAPYPLLNEMEER